MKRPLAFFLPLLVVLGSAAAGRAQTNAPAPEAPKKTVAEDGIPVFTTRTVVIRDKMTAEQRAARMDRLKKLSRFRRKVLKVYPIARQVATLVNQINEDTQNMRHREREKHLRELEKALKGKNEQTIRRLTRSEGRILLKLIYRETDNTTYALIKEYKSSAAAGFFFVLGKLFKMNLKQDYDPHKEIAIETVVREIERGEYDKYNIRVSR